MCADLAGGVVRGRVGCTIESMLDVHWDGGFGDVGVWFNVEGKPADSVCAGAAISPGGNDVMDDDWSSIMAGDRSLR